MKTVDSALKILQLFQSEKHTLSVTEIAAALDLEKSKVSRLLAAFRRNGFLEQDAVTKRYKVGLAAFELGSNYVKSQPIAHEALPIMRGIVDSTGHSTTLTVMHDWLALHIMAVEGPYFIDGRWRVGNRLPIHATSAGKVLLAGLENREVDEFLATHPLREITKQTVTDPAVLQRQLDKIRKTGVCVSRGESAPGLVAVAVPVLGATNKTVAALGLILPEQMFETTTSEKLSRSLHDGARRLSIRLGASVYAYGDATASLNKKAGSAVRRLMSRTQ
jgi:DNA-binding IclR family transcriptional regulator